MPDIRKTIGKYEILELVGRGGMGSVYKSRDPVLERLVAIKVLHSVLEIDRERFLLEGRAAARLHHPNLVTIYGFDIEGDSPYIVQELLTGTDLNRLLEHDGDAFDLAAKLGVLVQVGRGLDAVHGAGVVHRDLKPSNIRVLESGVVKVADFGIAKLTNRPDTTVTIPGAFVGTWRYASPEQFLGHEIGPAADIFSFGLVAYELMSGRRVFEGASMGEVAKARLRDDIPRLRDAVHGCHPALDRTVSVCLQLKPSERPTSMSLVVAELEKLRSVLDFVEPVESVVATAVSKFAGTSAPKSSPRSDTSSLTGRGSTTSDSSQRPEGTQPGVRSRTLSGTPSPQSHPIRIGAAPSQEQRDTPSFGGPHRASVTNAGTEGGTGVTPHAGLGTRESDELPRQVGPYTLLHFIARGRTGDHYKAYDPVRQQLVVLKVLHDQHGIAQRRLLRGAKIWLGFSHPNLVRVLHVDLGGADHPPLVVTELIDDTDLARLVTQLSMKEKLHVTIQLCSALGYMHNQGVLHREVNPRNILVSADTRHVTLLDSGIARRADPDIDQLTEAGVAVGDSAYIAPEQAKGSLDQRSDIYSVGAVLFEMLVGASACSMGTTAARERMEKEIHPTSLRETVARALRTHPDERFSHVEELADRLARLTQEAPSQTQLSRVVVTLHGIRTYASWQRAFSEVATQKGLECRLDRWNYGYFSVVKFLLPGARRGRVSWFRRTYEAEFGGSDTPFPLSEELPSIVAHSFGTYILGNALLRYPYLRFNKVLLCGSILPPTFPWEEIIARGQVQAVRNEYGARDAWTRMVQWFVPGTGPSGIDGFEAEPSERFEQERFDFKHSEYFARSHMLPLWIPFLSGRIGFNSPRESFDTLEYSAKWVVPWGLLLGYAVLFAGVVLLWRLFSHDPM